MTTRIAKIVSLGIGVIACVALASEVEARTTIKPPKIRALPNCSTINQPVTLSLNSGAFGAIPTADTIWTVTLPTPTTAFSTTPVASAWLSPFSGSANQWIQPNSSGSPANFPGQLFVYSTQFSTPVDPYFYDSITITGQFAVDNTAVVKLNGVQIATCTNASTCFSTATPIPSAPLTFSNFNRLAPFVNTLTIEVRNNPSSFGDHKTQSGLLIQAQVVAVCSKCTSPAPSTEPPCGGNPSTCRSSGQR